MQDTPPLSCSAAEALFDIANWCGIVGALLALIGVAGVFYSGSIKDRYAEIDRSELRRHIDPRTLSSNQRQIVVADLRRTGWQKATIIWFGNGEPELYARDIACAFDQSGIKTILTNRNAVLQSAQGIVIIKTEDDTSTRLQAILGDAGVDADIDEPSAYIQSNETPYIVVGARNDFSPN